MAVLERVVIDIAVAVQEFPCVVQGGVVRSSGHGLSKSDRVYNLNLRLQKTLPNEMQSSANTIPTASTLLFPYEIIFYILHFLNPCEVIRLRLVRSSVSQRPWASALIVFC